MKRFILAWLVFAVVVNSKAQTNDLSTLSASSYEGTTNSVVITYNVGEMVLTDTWSISNLLISQGILQPVNNEITGLNSFTIEELKVYPNPTSGVLIVTSHLNQAGKYSFTIMDAVGNIVKKQEVAMQQEIREVINLSTLAAGTYFLRIDFLPSSRISRSGVYKIIKTY
jgi:hypothetical protein